MGALIAAYVAAWVGVVLYVARLAGRQRRLQRQMDAIQSMVADLPTEGSTRAA